MVISDDFQGGNIKVIEISGDTIYLDNDLRDTIGDWFYWAFRVDGAAGRTIRFVFPKERVGRFGAAFSYNFENWNWTNTYEDNSFSYSFGEDEDSVYFAHHILYPIKRFNLLLAEQNLVSQVLCRSRQDREVPYLTFGNGEQAILLTAGHHACESTGMYVLEGVLSYLISNSIPNYKVICIPFVDFDGVIDGDQGKNRNPHDHNRDYFTKEKEYVYPETKAISRIINENRVICGFDFHSPYHMWERNDTVFFSLGNPRLDENASKFSSFFLENTKGLILNYKGETNAGGNYGWNSPTNPNFKNYLSKKEEVKLAFTLETPYFGLQKEEVTIENLLKLGNAFGKSISEYIKNVAIK